MVNRAINNTDLHLNNSSLLFSLLISAIKNGFIKNRPVKYLRLEEHSSI
jgi:hypothetical protein